MNIYIPVNLHTHITNRRTGTFTFLYKFLLNALPILIPAIKPRPFSLPFRRIDHSSPFVDDDLESGPTAEHPSTTLHVPIPTSKRKARLSLSASAQLTLIRKKARRWHAAFAGALAGGIAIIWEKRARRRVIAQQMFVRYVTSFFRKRETYIFFPSGLQGSYNAYTIKRNLHVPHGDVLVFSLA